MSDNTQVALGGGVAPVQRREVFEKLAAFFGFPSVKAVDPEPKLVASSSPPLLIINGFGNAFTTGLQSLYGYLGGIQNGLVVQTIDLSDRSKLAREAQTIAQRLEVELERLNGMPNQSTVTIDSTDPICQFIKEHGIEIEDVYSASHAESEGFINEYTFSLSQLTGAKIGVINFANNLTDIAAQKQLLLQKMIQSINQALLLMNSLQTIPADLGKSCWHGIKF